MEALRAQLREGLQLIQLPVPPMRVLQPTSSRPTLEAHRLWRQKQLARMQADDQALRLEVLREVLRGAKESLLKLVAGFTKIYNAQASSVTAAEDDARHDDRLQRTELEAVSTMHEELRVLFPATQLELGPRLEALEALVEEFSAKAIERAMSSPVRHRGARARLAQQREREREREEQKRWEQQQQQAAEAPWYAADAGGAAAAAAGRGGGTPGTRPRTAGFSQSPPRDRDTWASAAEDPRGRRAQTPESRDDDAEKIPDEVDLARTHPPYFPARTTMPVRTRPISPSPGFYFILSLSKPPSLRCGRSTCGGSKRSTPGARRCTTQSSTCGSAWRGTRCSCSRWWRTTRASSGARWGGPCTRQPLATPPARVHKRSPFLPVSHAALCSFLSASHPSRARSRMRVVKARPVRELIPVLLATQRSAAVLAAVELEEAAAWSRLDYHRCIAAELANEVAADPVVEAAAAAQAARARTRAPSVQAFPAAHPQAAQGGGAAQSRRGPTITEASARDVGAGGAAAGRELPVVYVNGGALIQACGEDVEAVRDAEGLPSAQEALVLMLKRYSAARGACSRREK